MDDVVLARCRDAVSLSRKPYGLSDGLCKGQCYPRSMAGSWSGENAERIGTRQQAAPCLVPIDHTV